jgi:hypothetical protein
LDGDCLESFGTVEGKTVRRLTEKLGGLVTEEMLLSLMNQLASELPSHAFCMAALIILWPSSDRAFEEAFRCFAELLGQVDLGAEVIDFAEEVSDRLNSSKLAVMNATLGARPISEGGDRLDGLRLKEAYALLREGEAEAAICLVNTLRMTSHLEREVLRFFDEAGWSSGKLRFLEQRLSAKLEEISRDSPSLTEALSILHQLTEAKLQSHKPEVVDQCLISLKAEVLNETVAQDARIQRLEDQTQRKEADDQMTLAGVSAKVEALTEDLEKAGEEISQVRKAQDSQIQQLDEKLNKTETETQEALKTLREDLDQAQRQCKQVQEAMLQRLEEQSQMTEANALNRDPAETSLQDTREALYHEAPTFIYSYTFNTDQLHRTNLVTGEQSNHQVPSYTFNRGCCWSEMPGGSLLITGGGWTAVSEVVMIDARTFEVSAQPRMLTPRAFHAAVYHAQHLYVLGGMDHGALSKCERYACEENRWQALSPLPRACRDTSGVVVESSLYALGGHFGSEELDLVQKLSLESLTWELLQLRLPRACIGIPCFKLSDTEAYLVVSNTLCSFTGLEVSPLKTLTEGISSWYGASYYQRGTLYCSSSEGAVLSYEIGSLSN